MHRIYLPLASGSGALPKPVPLTLFARDWSDNIYYRSDDGGVSWRCLNLPSSGLQSTTNELGQERMSKFPQFPYLPLCKSLSVLPPCIHQSVTPPAKLLAWKPLWIRNPATA